MEGFPKNGGHSSEHMVALEECFLRKEIHSEKHRNDFDCGGGGSSSSLAAAAAVAAAVSAAAAAVLVGGAAALAAAPAVQ